MTTAAVLRAWQAPVPSRPEIGFALRFVVLVGLIGGGYALVDPDKGAIAATAYLTQLASGLAGLSAEVLSGPGRALPVQFSDGAFSYLITSPCTGIAFAVLYTGAVFAFPATWQQRALGLAVGLPVIGFLNIVRLVVLGWAGLYAPSLFDQIHFYWYQAFLIVIAGLGWFAWATFVVGGARLTEKTRTRLRVLGSAVGLFVLTFALLGLVGAIVGAPRAYLRLLSWALSVVGGIVYEDHVQMNLGGPGFSTFATLSAVVALFVAVPSAPWRARLRALAKRGLPGVFAAHVAHVFVQYAMFRASATGAPWPSWGATPAEVVLPWAATILPLTLWLSWTRSEWPRNAPHARTESVRRR